jgi:hypothetical protein
MFHVRYPPAFSIILLTELRCDNSSMHATQDIRTDFPDIDYPVGFELISGFLTVPLSAEGKDFIVFFRRSQLEVSHHFIRQLDSY